MRGTDGQRPTECWWCDYKFKKKEFHTRPNKKKQFIPI